MRLVMAVGILALAGRTASAAYIVELDAGDRMTVDSYWAEGDRMHLMRQGVDLSVPRGRVRSIHEVEGSSVEGSPVPRPAAGGTPAQSTSASREEPGAPRTRVRRRPPPAQHGR